MPIYEYECSCGSEFTRYLPVSDYLMQQTCACGTTASKVIRSAPMTFVEADIHYDSPIDGRPITNKQARMEDLARSNCVPYDPEQRIDYDRRVKRDEEKLEALIDDSIDREIENMPTRKKELLAGEMQGGMDIETVRTTPMENANA